MLAAVFWGIKQRSGLPAVPLLTPDSWGYLHPGLSWLGGAGFQQTDGRAWFYPAILTLILKVGGDFSWIVRVQQFFGLASAPFLWFGLRIWLSFFPKRTAVCHGLGVLLGATTAAIYLLNTTQVRFEMTIEPEGVLAFFVLTYLVFALAYIRMRWVSHQDLPAIVFGAATLLTSYYTLLLKPSWGFALIPSFLLVIAGIYGTGSRLLRWIPAVAAVVATSGLFILPHLLGFRPDASSRTFLPFTLVSIHAAQILQNAEKEHLIVKADPPSNEPEARFYQELKEAWVEARSDFAAHSVSKRRALDISARFSPSPQVLLTEAESKDYLRNQPMYLAYLANLEKVHQQGWQIDCVNWLRYVAIVLAKIASIIQVAFLVSLIPIFLNRRFSDLRLPALAAVMISTAVYGNMLTVGVVHTLDLDRYRTGYVPALLLTLAMMTTVLFAVAERWRAREAAGRGPME